MIHKQDEPTPEHESPSITGGVVARLHRDTNGSAYENACWFCTHAEQTLPVWGVKDFYQYYHEHNVHVVSFEFAEEHLHQIHIFLYHCHAIGQLDSYIIRCGDLLLTEKDLPLVLSDEDAGSHVRDSWVECAKEDPNSPAHHLTLWKNLDERNKQIDRRIGHDLVNVTLRRLLFS